MSDLGYTFTTPPYKERINGIVQLKFNIEGIEQNYQYPREMLTGIMTMNNNTIQNATDDNIEKTYFLEIFDSIPDPDPELNTIEEM